MKVRGVVKNFLDIKHFPHVSTFSLYPSKLITICDEKKEEMAPLVVVDTRGRKTLWNVSSDFRLKVKQLDTRIRHVSYMFLKHFVFNSAVFKVFYDFQKSDFLKFQANIKSLPASHLAPSL